MALSNDPDVALSGIKLQWAFIAASEATLVDFPIIERRGACWELQTNLIQQSCSVSSVF